MSKRFIVLPPWVEELRKQAEALQDRITKIEKRMNEMNDDLKSLKQLAEEKNSRRDNVAQGIEIAQGMACPNVPIIAGQKRRLKSGEHSRKSIHELTYSYEQKINPIEKNIDTNI